MQALFSPSCLMYYTSPAAAAAAAAARSWPASVLYDYRPTSVFDYQSSAFDQHPPNYDQHSSRDHNVSTYKHDQNNSREHNVSNYKAEEEKRDVTGKSFRIADILGLTTNSHLPRDSQPNGETRDNCSHAITTSLHQVKKSSKKPKLNGSSPNDKLSARTNNDRNISPSDCKRSLQIGLQENDSHNTQDSGSVVNNKETRKKKARTTFSGRQIFELERQFEKKKYLSSTERSEMAVLLNVTEQQVKIWFQNRRTKWKKSEGMTNAEVAEYRHDVISVRKNRNGVSKSRSGTAADNCTNVTVDEHSSRCDEGVVLVTDANSAASKEDDSSNMEYSSSESNGDDKSCSGNNAEGASFVSEENENVLQPYSQPNSPAIAVHDNESQFWKIALLRRDNAIDDEDKKKHEHDVTDMLDDASTSENNEESNQSSVGLDTHSVVNVADTLPHSSSKTANVLPYSLSTSFFNSLSIPTNDTDRYLKDKCILVDKCLQD